MSRHVCVGAKLYAGAKTYFRYLHNPCLVMNARGGVNHPGLITTTMSVRPFLLTMLITFSFCGGVCSASLHFGFPGSPPAFQQILQNTLCRIVNMGTNSRFEHIKD
jgi:hypothetical protein